MVDVIVDCVAPFMKEVSFEVMKARPVRMSDCAHNSAQVVFYLPLFLNRKLVRLLL